MICAAAFPAGADAQAFQVDRATDESTTPACTIAPADCSLRQAITMANTTVGADSIVFAASYMILIDTPLPKVTEQLAINPGNTISETVTGRVSYPCSPPGVYALDITASTAAQPITISRTSFNAVCGFAIQSLVPPPTVTVGPRRANNTVSINGTSGNGTSVEIFNAKTVTADGEADSVPNGFFQQTLASAGSYAYTPLAVPATTDVFAATTTAPEGTSNFSARAHTPADLTSPTLNSVVAVSNSRVRLDFSETLGGGGLAPSAFFLGMANVERPVVGVSTLGNSIYLDSTLPWSTGEAGALSLTGNGPVNDVAGNEVIGQPIAPVFAGPGELDAPTISNFRLSPNRLCQRKSSACRRGSTSILMTLNKPARVIFKIARGSTHRTELVTFVHKLKAGRNKVKFNAVVSGRTLPAALMTIRATAQDVARTYSAPVDTPFKVVKKNRDL